MDLEFGLVLQQHGPINNNHHTIQKESPTKFNNYSPTANQLTNIIYQSQQQPSATHIQRGSNTTVTILLTNPNQQPTTEQPTAKTNQIKTHQQPPINTPPP